MQQFEMFFQERYVSKFLFFSFLFSAFLSSSFFFLFFFSLTSFPNFLFDKLSIEFYPLTHTHKIYNKHNIQTKKIKNLTKNTLGHFIKQLMGIIKTSFFLTNLDEYLPLKSCFNEDLR